MNFIRQNPDTIPERQKNLARVWNDLPILLLALIPMVIIVPVLPPEPSSRVVIVFFLTLLFVTGIYCMRGNRRRFLLSCILALIATETFWVSIWPAAGSLFLLGELFFILFMAHLAGTFSWELTSLEGTLVDLISAITALVLIGGIILGASLHLSGIVSRAIPLNPATIHSSFAQAIPEGVLLLIRGGEPTFGSSPLTIVILMIGSVCGFLLLILATGKIVGYFVKNRE